MSKQPHFRQQPSSTAGAAWEVVRRWDGLPPTAKLIWLKLWEDAECKPNSIIVAPTGLADHYGIEPRAARRGLDALINAALIEGPPNRKGGRWPVYVADPAERQIARRRASADQQASLPIAVDPPDGDKTDPDCPDPSLLSVPLLQSAVRLLAAKPLDEVGEEKHLAERIIARVRDPKLRRSPVLRVARAIVSGQLDRDEIKQLLEDLDSNRNAGTLRSAPWCYFVGGAKKIFRRCGLEWPDHG